MPTTNLIRILLIEDNEADVILAQRVLRSAGLSVEVTWVDTVGAIHRALRDTPWDVVLCDYSVPGLDVVLVLELAAEAAPGVPVVVVTGAVGEEAVAELMRHGLADVVLKDNIAPRLGAVVRREVERSRERSARAANRQLSEAVLGAFNIALDWRAAVEAALECLGANFGAALAIMWEVHGPESNLQPIASWTTPGFVALNTAMNTRELPAGKTVIGNSLLRGESALIPRIGDLAYTTEGHLAAGEAAAAGIYGVVCHPLSASDRQFGLEFLFATVRDDLDAVLRELSALSVSLQPLLFRRLIEHERNLLRDALDAARNGVIITEAATVDPPGPRIVYANRAVSTISGYDLHDLFGATPRILQGPGTDRDALGLVRRALVVGESVTVELQNYRRDGTPFFAEVDITPVHDQGRVTHFIAIQTDITNRHKAEQERIQREALFRTAELKAAAEVRDAKQRAEAAEALLRDAIDSMSEGFVIFDCEDRFVMCNAVYRQLYAEAASMLLPGVPFEDIMRQAHTRGGGNVEKHEDNERWIADRLRHHREGGAVFEQPLRDGSWILVTDRRMRSGGITGLRVNITDLKQTQMALRESEERLDRAQAIARVGSWELDVATGQYFWSNEMYRIRGVSRQDFNPNIDNTSTYIHADDYPLFRHWVAALSAGLEQGARESRIVRPDGEVRTLRVEGRAIADSNGVVSRVAGTMQDITERRMIESQLFQAQKMDAIGTLTGGMAHDFNNMLGVIMVNLELLKRRVDTDAMASELCGEALDGANRCAEVIRRLLAFARRQPLNPEPTDVNAWIRDITRLLDRTLGETIAVVLNLDGALWPVMVDPVQFETTLVNLATNARDAMQKGGTLTFATRNIQIDERDLALHQDASTGAFVLIEITDTGTGIPPEIISRIFEPFFTTKRPGEGTGLGLSMAFGFAKQSGGHLSVYSELDRGTTFRLYLPLGASGGDFPAVPTQASAAIGGHEIVLAVEDNAQLRKAAVRQLRDLGYDVREADHADSAMAVLASGEKVDLLLTDVVMPGTMDGLELAYRATQLRQDLKVLLVSGFPGIAGSERRIVGSPFPLLSKPYRRDQLARAVRAVFDKTNHSEIDDNQAIGCMRAPGHS